MLNILIYRKFDFAKPLYFVKGPSLDKVMQLSPDKVKGREVKEKFS